MQSSSVARIHDRRPRPARAPQAPARLRLARVLLRRLGRDLDGFAAQHAAPRGRDGARQAAEAAPGVPRAAHLRGRAPGAGRRRDRRDHARLRRTRRGAAPPGAVPRPRLRPRASAIATAGCGSSTGSSTTTTTSSCSARWSAAASTRATGSSCSSGSVRASSPSRPSTPSTSSPRAARGPTSARPGANTPMVYVARGSHANYFRAGSHWTGVWWDQADGRGPADHADARGAGGPHAGLGALAGLVGGHEGDGVAAGLGEPAQPGAAAALERPVACWSRRRAGWPRRRPRCSRRRHRRVIARREGDRVIVKAEGPGPMVVRRARVGVRARQDVAVRGHAGA